MEKNFFFLYSLFAFILYLLASPFLLLFSFKTKYREALPSRFFLWKNSRLKADGIWFHCCSFGEVKAIAGLVDKLPREALRMSTTTQTGHSAAEVYTEQSRYLPFEFFLLWWIRPQKALVVMEAEFWYLLFAVAQKRGAKTYLINARMSERSFPKYQRIGWLYRQIFKHIDGVYAQSEIDKERLEALGARHVTVTGNIKLAHLQGKTKSFEKPSGMTLCAASTHEGEEGLILEAFIAFKEENPDARLVVVPRHPERFDKVAKEIESIASARGYRWHRFSQNKRLESDIILVDALGELINLYAMTDIVILGGAFVPVGGHNAAEAAQFGCKIISGKHYFNQKDVFSSIEGIAIVENSALKRRLLEHGVLKRTVIKRKSDTRPILEALQRVL